MCEAGRVANLANRAHLSSELRSYEATSAEWAVRSPTRRQAFKHLRNAVETSRDEADEYRSTLEESEEARARHTDDCLYMRKEVERVVQDTINIDQAESKQTRLLTVELDGHRVLAVPVSIMNAVHADGVETYAPVFWFICMESVAF